MIWDAKIHNKTFKTLKVFSVKIIEYKKGVDCELQIMVGDSLPPPPGWLISGCTSRSPHVAAPRSEKYGATQSSNPSRGGELPRLWSSFPPVAEGGRCANLTTSCYSTGAYLWHAIYIYLVNPAQLRKCRAMIRKTALR